MGRSHISGAADRRCLFTFSLGKVRRKRPRMMDVWRVPYLPESSPGSFDLLLDVAHKKRKKVLKRSVTDHLMSLCSLRDPRRLPRLSSLRGGLLG